MRFLCLQIQSMAHSIVEIKQKHFDSKHDLKFLTNQSSKEKIAIDKYVSYFSFISL